MNINILGTSKLKWTGMGEFNSDGHCIYYCGQESLRRNGVAIIINKRVQNAVLGCSLKNDRMISVRFQGKPLNIMVIQVYAYWGPAPVGSRDSLGRTASATERNRERDKERILQLRK